MKVKELLNILKQCDLDAEVMLSTDEEGNYYSNCTGYAKDCTFINVGSFKGKLEAEYIEEDKGEEGIACIVLYP
jgi:hypothetical protein